MQLDGGGDGESGGVGAHAECMGMEEEEELHVHDLGEALELVRDGDAPENWLVIQPT